jgi:hypothetical protein
MGQKYISVWDKFRLIKGPFEAGFTVYVSIIQLQY